MKRNLLGALEAALFMRPVGQRFGNTAEEAARSFFIPILLLPISLLAVYIYPRPYLDHRVINEFALLYCLRGGISWAMFFATVYVIAKQVDRREHFWQFVIATNWLSIPATLVFLPIALKILGGESWNALQPAMMMTMLYTYAFTGYTAARILRAPWELGGFIAMIAFMVNNYTADILRFLTHV